MKKDLEKVEEKNNCDNNQQQHQQTACVYLALFTTKINQMDQT